MEKLILFILICCSVKCIATEKSYYTGTNNVVTGWQHTWPDDQLALIDDICEAIINDTTGFPEDIRHLKLNGDGTLKCPAELDSTRVVVADAEDVDNQAMLDAKKSIACGLKVKARMLVQNSSKSLTDIQKVSIVTTYSTIDALLSAGSLSTARVEILAVTADGVIVTEADKTALVAELDKCI